MYLHDETHRAPDVVVSQRALLARCGKIAPLLVVGASLPVSFNFLITTITR
jgi:hypothetical protein